MCGSESYPRIKEKTVGLTNNYHVSRYPTCTITLTEELESTQTSSEKKTSKTNKKGGSDYFHCGDQHHRACKCPHLSDTERAKLNTTKKKCGRVNTQVSEVVYDNEQSEDGIYMPVKQKTNHWKKLHSNRIYLDNFSTYNQMYNEYLISYIMGGISCIFGHCNANTTSKNKKSRFRSIWCYIKKEGIANTFSIPKIK